MTAALVATTVSLPALAAPKPKPKPKPITVTYKVQLVPDYTLNVAEGCASVIPRAQDKRGISIPAKGILKVTLNGGDHPGGGDWDLYTLTSAGDLLSASESEGVVESTVDRFKGKTAASIWVCNLSGTPDGTVTYTFTYT